MAYATEPMPSNGHSEAASPGNGLVFSWLERAVAAVERNSRWLLAAMMLIEAALLLYMGRGLSFFYDDWDLVTHDYGGGIHSLLAAHVGNPVLFPVAIYKVLFHLVGLDHYTVFLLVVVILHLTCGGLVFVLAAKRIPRAPALLAAALILFLGAAWEDLLWAFQVTYMLSVAGGLAAWVLLERDDRWSKVAATLCLVVAAGSSSLGIAIMIGVIAELAWGRRWRSGWIVLIPVLLYALWYLGYGENQITANGLINAPGFAEDMAAAAFGGLIGRALEWGRPLALLGALLLGRRILRPLPLSARLAGLLATGLSLWAITAVARSTISQPEASRYIYLGAIVTVLAGVELLHDVTITLRSTALATVLTGVCALAGLTVLHAGATGLRSTSKTVTAELGALELAAAYAPSGYQVDPERAPQIMAGPYLHTVRAIGSSPADTPAEIATADPASRAAADGLLMALEVPKLVPYKVTKRSATTPRLTVSALVSATQISQEDCVELTPLPGATMTGVLVLPREAVVLHDRGTAPTSLALRRFADTFMPLAGAVAPLGVAKLAIPPDDGRQPWSLQVASSSSLSICEIQHE